MQHTITRAQFNEWATANEARLRSDYGFPMMDAQSMEEDGHDMFDELRACLTAATEKFVAMMAENGLTITEDSVTFDPARLAVIDAHAVRVLGDYDGENDRSTEDPDSPWVLFELGGDDDVDYNGSYITAGLSALQNYPV